MTPAEAPVALEDLLDAARAAAEADPGDVYRRRVAVAMAGEIEGALRRLKWSEAGDQESGGEPRGSDGR